MKRLITVRAASLFLLALLSAGSYARANDSVGVNYELQDQTIKVSGQVVDESNLPMAGVLVQVEGTTSGAVTDGNGAYVIPKVKQGANLIFTFVGYKTVTIPANTETVNTTMAIDALGVEEVVVVGFGSQKKVNLTGSVAVADKEVFESRPVQSATQALQGAVPGLNISSTSGSLDAASSINIRGMSTIGSGSSGDPLILIDGMEGDLNSLNPQDIESVSVLKDAASSSIYGSRAPFGVILVTTKSGKKEKMTVNYNNSFRFSRQIGIADCASSWQYVNFINDAMVNSGKSPKFKEKTLQDILDYNAGKITATTVPNPDDPSNWSNVYNVGYTNDDWIDNTFKDWTFGQEHTLSINGGTEKQQIYASANYLNQSGFLDFGSDSSKRYSTNLKASGEIFDFLKYVYNIKFQRLDYTKPTSMSNGFFAGLKNAPPLMPLYDANGYLFWRPIIALEDGGETRMRKDKLYQQFRLIATPLEGWNITAELNYNLNTSLTHADQQVYYRHNAYGDPVVADSGESSVTESMSSSNYMNPNVFSDYSFSLNDSHNFKVMAGFQAERYTLGEFSAKRNGIVVPYMDVIDVTSGLDATGSVVAPIVSGSGRDWATVGFFGRINYDYEGRYLVEANLRYDGTSRFRTDQRWNLFPSFSVGWNIAEEGFWEDYKDVVGTLKLRASYGELGNQNTTNLYPTYQKMVVESANSKWLINGIQQNSAKSPALLNSAMTWETIKTTNIGLDFRAFRNRLSGSFDWFDRTTSDMVGPAPELPLVLGKDVPLENNTDLRTSGWELSFRWNDRTSGGLGYSAAFQIADSKTKILNYPNENMNLGLTYTGGVPKDIYYTGQNVGDIYGYTTIAIAKTQAEMDAHLATLPNGGQQVIGNKWSAGDIMYKDINGDGRIDYGAGTVNDSGDLSVIGNNLPRYTVGLNLSADYKGFDISAFFQGVLKRDYMINSQTFWGHSNYNNNTFPLAAHMDYFRNDPESNLGLNNVDPYYPRPILRGKNNSTTQTRYLQDASYIRLKNLQVGYTFNQKLTNKIGMSNLRVFASGENLWTATKLTEIYDPETITGGFDGIGYSLQSVMSFGFNVNF